MLDAIGAAERSADQFGIVRLVLDEENMSYGVRHRMLSFDDG
jgi:hypothetical protein